MALPQPTGPALQDRARMRNALVKESIIFISTLSVVAMMLASCESIPSSFNPFTPETTTTSTSGSPETGQTNRATYEMPLGRSPENHISTDY
jgi:hypothetical protein